MAELDGRFTPEERAVLRETLIAVARDDRQVAAAALVGSAATGREDRWSDIDLVLGIDTAVGPDEVARRWTEAMYAQHGAVHHLDVVAGGVLYRVFLLGSSLQVDISFWPQDEVRATQDGFQLLFGSVNEPTTPSTTDPGVLIGWAWLYALHARSALARGRTWQAVMMLDDLRDQVLALACVRHGLVAHHGRGIDQLPTAVLAPFSDAHAADLSSASLARRFRRLLELLLAEIAEHDRELADRVEPSLRLLAGDA